MNWLLYVLAGFMSFSLLTYLNEIGKPRKPMSGSDAIIAVVIFGTLIPALVIAAMRLS